MPLMNNLKRFVRGEDYEEEDSYYQEEEEAERPMQEAYNDATTRWGGNAAREEAEPQRSEPAATPAYSTPAANAGGYSGYSRPESEKGRVVNMNHAAQLSVVLVTPDRYATAAEIAKHLLEKRTVVLNMEQTNREVARRLLDFLGGVAYAQDGKVRRVANSTFIITPANVDLEGELTNEPEGEEEEIVGRE